jgi:O-antigen ligase
MKPLTLPASARAALQRARVNRREGVAGTVFLIGSALFGAAVFGLAIALFPPFIVGVAAVLLVLLPLYVARPAWLIVPAIAFQLLFPRYQVVDVTALLLFARAAVSLASQGGRVRALLGDDALKPLYVLALLIAVSFGMGVTVLEHGRTAAYNDARVFFYWLWLLPFFVWAPVQRPERWLARIVLGVATIVAAVAVVQGVFGIALPGSGRVSQLETLGQFSSDLTRVQIPGFIFVLLGVFICAARLVGPGQWGRKALHLGLAALFVLAVIFNFGRALWFWTVVGVGLTAVLMGLRATLKVGLVGAVVAVALGFGIATVKPRLAEGIVERVVSVAEEGGANTSFGWRQQENLAARRVLDRTYLLGTGLGGEYRSPVLGLRTFENHTWYIHNGHLSVLLKLSILGYLVYLWLIGRMGRRLWQQRRAPGGDPALAAAAAAWLLVFMGLNITQPELMTTGGVTLLSLLLALAVLGPRTAAPHAAATVPPYLRRHTPPEAAAARWRAADRTVVG